jgi:hypothetical protein
MEHHGVQLQILVGAASGAATMSTFIMAAVKALAAVVLLVFEI